MLDSQTSIDTVKLARALNAAGFVGEVETDSALRAAMSTDNSVYQITPDLIVAPRNAEDLVVLLKTMEEPTFTGISLTARGGGTGTNGQSLNSGIVVDLRRHMNQLVMLNEQEGWADVEPGMVLDDLNERLQPFGWFFAPETSTSSRCTIGGMVSTDASGKGSRIYGKTSDNVLALQIARPEGLLDSDAPVPDWAVQMLTEAEDAARLGRAAFIANTPRLNRRFTGYDLERACPDTGGFEWWRLFLGAEGTLGLVSRIRVRLRRIENEKRLIVVGFNSLRNALVAARPLLAAEPTAVEVMDETIQAIAETAGILTLLPPALRVEPGQRVAYLFIEINGDDFSIVEDRVTQCQDILATLAGVGQVHISVDMHEIRELWAIRSAGVGLLGKVDGIARPVAFVEDAVVPPENLPAFVDDFLDLLKRNGLSFGISGHVDVGCLHIRPALNIDSATDRSRLVEISDAVYALTRKYGGIFWGEHGKGVRGAYLRDWIGPEAYLSLQRVKAAFDSGGRYNPGKLVSNDTSIMGIATTPFRAFNAPESDALTKAFRCNGNAQCLSYAAGVPMCPSFKATADVRHSPKGRADALRGWHTARATNAVDLEMREIDLLGVLDTCLGCKACSSSCPVQVDIPSMRSTFYADYFARHRRSFMDRMVLIAERISPLTHLGAPVLSLIWPIAVRSVQRMTGSVDLPERLAAMPRRLWLTRAELAGRLPDRTIILVQDWFTALFDGPVQHDVIAGLTALGYHPRLLPMLPSGKAAHTAGDLDGFGRMASNLSELLALAAGTGAPLVAFEPAFGMMLRQEYPMSGIDLPKVMMVQEFLLAEAATRVFPQALHSLEGKLLSHCTEVTAAPNSPKQWTNVFAAIGLSLTTPSTGCCGMAGLFGHQKRHQTVSRKLFEMSWRKQIEDSSPLMVTGFSCRCQTKRLSGRTSRHPLGIIAEALAS